MSPAASAASIVSRAGDLHVAFLIQPPIEGIVVQILGGGSGLTGWVVERLIAIAVHGYSSLVVGFGFGCRRRGPPDPAATVGIWPIGPGPAADRGVWALAV